MVEFLPIGVNYLVPSMLVSRFDFDLFISGNVHQFDFKWNAFSDGFRFGNIIVQGSPINA